MKDYTNYEHVFLITLGQNIRRLRALKGITQQNLSAVCDMEESLLSRIENGRTNSTLNTIKKIMDALQVTPGDVFKDI